jgi:shikimate dehydrogenase
MSTDSLSLAQETRIIDGTTKVCALIGNPVSSSLSPFIHNTGYSLLGLQNKYVYTAFEVKPDMLHDAIKGASALQVSGLSFTIPFKEKVIPYLDTIDIQSQAIGAVNTAVLGEQGIMGYNTDWLGVAIPIVMHLDSRPWHDHFSLKADFFPLLLQNQRAAILGYGGAAKAAAYALKTLGAAPVFFGRSKERSKTLTEQYNTKFFHFNDSDAFAALDSCSVIFNGTPIGMKTMDPEGYLNNSPLQNYRFLPSQLVFDSVYAPHRTKLLSDAKESGAAVIYGIDMLLIQAMYQFELFTGFKAPYETIRKTVLGLLGVS